MRIAKSAYEMLAVPVVVLLVWLVGSSFSSSFYFPPLAEILTQFGELWFSERLFTDVLPSVGRLLAGYGLSCVVGILIGLALGMSWRARSAAEPVLEFFRAIPPPALVPVLILLLGFGDQMKIWVIVVGSIWPILLNTVDGVRGHDEVLDETCQSYQFRWHSRLRHMVLPGAMPRIFAGARQGLSIAIILMVISEMFAATDGLGAAIILFQRSFAMPEMWSGVLLLGLIGFGLSMLFEFVERRSLGWYHESRQLKEG